MQRYDPRLGGGDRKSPNTTYALAQFLATTGPSRDMDYQAVSFADYHQRSAQSNKMNLFDRLRKKTSYANTKYAQQQQQQGTDSTPISQSARTNPTPFNKPMVHRKYIPLADDINQPNSYRHPNNKSQQQLAFYDTEDTSYTNVGDEIPSFPTPPASSLHESMEAQDPSLPLSSTSTSVSEQAPAVIPRSKTATPQKKPIRGLRHIQVQTEDPPKNPPFERPPQEDKERCDLCCRPFNLGYMNAPNPNRRASCPAVLPSGAKIKLGQEATLLLALIDQLKQQLAEEQQSRKILEKAIQLQWAADKKN